MPARPTTASAASAAVARCALAGLITVAIVTQAARHARAEDPTPSSGTARGATTPTSESAPQAETPLDTTPTEPDAPAAAAAAAASASSSTAAESPAPPRRRYRAAAIRLTPPPRPQGPDAPEYLSVPGLPGAWFYRAATGHRRSRVIVYLHGRGSDPLDHCRKLHRVARAYGWLLCPIGPGDRGGGRREWRNDRDYAAREVVATIDALVGRFRGRVTRHDNIMMGFSEGSYVGMNVALMNPRTFPRWFIVAADDRYIESERRRLERAQMSIQRVYLLTGSDDVTLPHSRRAHEALERLFTRRREKFRIVPGMPHALPADDHLTRNIFAWLSRD